MLEPIVSKADFVCPSPGFNCSDLLEQMCVAGNSYMGRLFVIFRFYARKDNRSCARANVLNGGMCCRLVWFETTGGGRARERERDCYFINQPLSNVYFLCFHASKLLRRI